MIQQDTPLSLVAIHWAFLRMAARQLRRGGFGAVWTGLRFWYWINFRATARQLQATAAYLQGLMEDRS